MPDQPKSDDERRAEIAARLPSDEDLELFAIKVKPGECPFCMMDAMEQLGDSNEAISDT